MYSSQHYKNKINRYNNIKSKLESKFTYFDTAIDKLKFANNFFVEDDGIIIGDRLDRGETSKILAEIQNARLDIKSIIKECDSKIAEYQHLYELAIAKELDEKEGADKDEHE